MRSRTRRTCLYAKTSPGPRYLIRDGPHMHLQPKEAFSKLLEALAIQQHTLLGTSCILSTFLAETIHRGHTIGT